LSKTEDVLAITPAADALEPEMTVPEPDSLTAEVVAKYLSDCPDFFLHRQELVEKLTLPTREQGAISLVEVQLQRQRQKIAELEEEITQLMSLASSNDRTFYEFMDLQEQVLKSTSIAGLIGRVNDKAKALRLRGYVLLKNAPEPRWQISPENLQQFATNHFNGKEAYLGRLRKTDRELLFGDYPVPELGSYVVLPLRKSTLQGVLAFSSEDGGHFQPNMDTLFLRHLALVVSHLVETLAWHGADG
jgi:hypothetical protein